MRITKKFDGFPVLLAIRNSVGGSQLAVWCPYCRRWHYHGSCGPNLGDGDGHRVADCLNPDSPFKKTGYVIKEVESIQHQQGKSTISGIREYRSPHPGSRK